MPAGHHALKDAALCNCRIGGALLSLPDFNWNVF
jgi:hypothetical protein